MNRAQNRLLAKSENQETVKSAISTTKVLVLFHVKHPRSFEVVKRNKL